MAGKKGMAQYSRDMKERAVRMHLEQGMTYPAITQALNIQDPNRVKVWVRVYRREGWAGLSKPKGRRPAGERAQAELERLRMENTLLKKFQAELRKVRLARRNIG